MNRWKRAAAAMLVIIQLALMGTAGAVPFGEDAAAIVQASKSVLVLQAFDGQDALITSGCGFVAFDNMSLVTSCGMIKDADWLMAIDNSGNRYLVTQVIAADEKKDIAILSFFSPTDMQPLQLMAPDAALPAVSSKVTAIGCKPWEEPMVITGTVTAARETDGVSSFEYEADATVLAGSPLIDDAGVVVGIAAHQNGEGSSTAVSFTHAGSMWTENISVNSKSFATFFGGKENEKFPFPLPDPDKVLSAMPTPMPKDLMTAPQNVMAEHTPSGMVITWNSADHAKQYSIYRSSQRDRGYVIIGSTDGMEFVDANAGNMLWFYKVESQREDGATVSSDAILGMPAFNESKKVAAPKNVKAKASPEQVAVTFGAVKNAQWYIVYRSDRKSIGYEPIGLTTGTSFADRDVGLTKVYYYKVCAVSDGYISSQSTAAAAKMPKPTPTMKPSPTPYVEPEFFLQMGREAKWNKKNGFWQVNPTVVNGSKTSTVNGFTLTYYCEDLYGQMIRKNGEGSYYTDASYEKTVKPGKSVIPGYTWLEGYKDPAYIGVAVTKIHTTDGRTIDIPRESWNVGYITLN